MKLIDADSLYERAYKLNLDYKVSDTELRVLKRLLMEEPIVIHRSTVLSIKEQILDEIKDINYAYNNCSKYTTIKNLLEELCEEELRQ